MRIVVKDTPLLRKVIRESMERVLRITDEDYMNEMEAPYMKLFIERLQKLLDNCKSWYRGNVTKQSESPVPILDWFPLLFVPLNPTLVAQSWLNTKRTP